MDEANSIFASILARAVVDNDIKAFLKKEALKEIDNDYDVIYQLVKDKVVRKNFTFRQALARCCDSEQYLDSITNYDPTLTISIPFLNEKHNAKIWNVEDGKMLNVVLRNFKISKDEQNLISYDHHGNKTYISRYQKPENLVLVVKSNERLINADSNINTKSQSLIGLENESGTFAYFLNDAYNNLSQGIITKSMTERFKDFILRSEKNIYAFFHEVPYHRDYIYYNIDPKNSITSGDFDRSYAEYLYNIVFSQPAVYESVADRSDPMGDWSDGNLEIHFNVLLSNREGKDIALSVEKVLSVAVEDLIHELRSVHPHSGLKYSQLLYKLPTPLQLFNWDLYKYGDTYKVKIFEFDPGNEITISSSVSSTYNANFTYSSEYGEGGHKINVGASGGQSTTNTSSTTIKMTDNSDELGESLVYFYDDIIIGDKIELQFGRTLGFYDRTQEAKFYSDLFEKVQHAPCNGMKSFNKYDTGSIIFTTMPLRK